MTTKCILHVGAGKCGSSSLQACLSENPSFEGNDGTQYVYTCIKDNNRVLRGGACRKAAAKSTYGYSASVSVRKFSDPLHADLKKWFRALESESVVPVLSFEGWMNEAVLFRDRDILGKLGIEATVVMFVRPQISWINSAWWQWGVWTRYSFANWLKKWKEKACWASAARKWQQVPGVDEVKVFTTGGDVVETFFDFLDAPLTEGTWRKNFSLDGNVLRLLQRNRALRAGRQQSAMHVMLGKHLDPGTKAAPWVIKAPLVADLIEYYRQDNEALLEMLDDKTKQEILDDARWWDATAFSNKRAERPGKIRPKPADAEEVAARAIRAVFELDEKLRGQ